MQHIARLLEIPGQSGPPSPAFVGSGIYSTRNLNRALSRENRPLFNTSRGPGFAAPKRENTPGIVHKADESRTVRREGVSPNRLPITNLKKEEKANTASAKPCRSRDSSGGRTRSREGSPRMPRPRSEEIPLELIKKAPNSVMDMSPKIAILSRPQTPRVEPEASTSAAQQEVVAGAQQQVSSEETSFIGDEGKSGVKKGAVETV